MTWKLPNLLIILGIVINEDNLMLPHFFLRDSRVNGIAYTKSLKLWITTVMHRRPYVYQFHSAPLQGIEHNNWFPKTLNTMSYSTCCQQPPPPSQILTWWPVTHPLGVGRVKRDFSRRNLFLVEAIYQYHSVEVIHTTLLRLSENPLYV